MPKPTTGPRLGGGPAHERLLLANLAAALFTHKSITTTETKVKRLRPFAERLVTFEGERAFVEIPPGTPEGQPEKREIKVGLSDGLSIEVREGLQEGDQVIQRPPKEIM